MNWKHLKISAGVTVCDEHHHLLTYTQSKVCNTGFEAAEMLESTGAQCSDARLDRKGDAQQGSDARQDLKSDAQKASDARYDLKSDAQKGSDA